jgi:plasmid stabilization system protein ParE
MAKRIVWTEQAKADVRAIEQPIALQILKTLAATPRPARATRNSFEESSRPDPSSCQDHRVFFRDKGDHLEISRVVDRKEAYR